MTTTLIKKPLFLIGLLGLLCGIGSFLLVKKVGVFFDIETKSTLTREELIETADHYAKLLGVDVKKKYKFLEVENNTLERFAMLKTYGYSEFLQRINKGEYNPELFIIEYSDKPWSTALSSKIILDDKGVFKGFEIGSFDLGADLTLLERHYMEVLLNKVEKFIPHFKKHYAQIADKELYSNGTIWISKEFDIKSTLVNRVFQKVLINQELVYYNQKDTTYVVLGLSNRVLMGLKYVNSLPKKAIDEAQIAWNSSKTLGNIFLILSILLALFLIISLRKRLPERDMYYVSKLAKSLALFVILNSFYNIYDILPESISFQQYLLPLLYFTLVCLGAIIYYFVVRYLLSVAESITRAVRPGQIPFFTSLSGRVLASYAGVNNLLTSYLVVPIGLFFSLITFWFVLQAGWMIVPRLNDSFLSFTNIIHTSVQAGVLEEIFFRGIIFGGMLWYIRRSQYKSVLTYCALIVQALLFSGIHNFSMSIPPYVHLVVLFPGGIILGLVYLYRGLFSAILTHILYDLLLLSFHQTNDWITIVFVAILGMIPILIFIEKRIKEGKWITLTQEDMNKSYVPKKL